MEELFVNETIAIHALSSHVWEVLTKPEFTKKWIGGFGMEGGWIESKWKVGSSVEWKTSDGAVKVSGKVTSSEPFKKLSFTVKDLNEKDDVPRSDRDGIVFTLSESGEYTTLSLSHGDFAKMPDYQKYYDATIKVWNTTLPKIKELAEKI